MGTNDNAFPRGGSSLLTPLEVKEISNEAVSDVLFESKKRSSSSNKDRKRQKKEQDKPKIQRYVKKGLIKGTQVLVQVTGMTDLDLMVSIGNQIFGTVPITSISEEVTKAIEEAEKSDESEDEDEDDEEANGITRGATNNEIPKLRKLFTVGQYLRAEVSENENKKIILTIEPNDVNSGVEKDDLKEGALIQCSVHSLEDNGVVMSIGMKGISGFMPGKNIQKLSEKSTGGSGRLGVGSVVLAKVASKKGRIVTLKPLYEDLNTTTTDVETISSVDAIKTGSMVECVVADVSSEGIATRVFGMVDGTLSIPHLGCAASAVNKYKVGTSVSARVIGVLLQEGEKRFVLSRAAHILQMQKSQKTRSVGDIVEASVVGSDSEYIYFGIGKDLGQVHRSKLRADYTVDVHYAVGTSHKARICGYNEMDRAMLLTVKEEDLEREYMSGTEVPIGAVVKCEVVKFAESGGILVKANGDVEGFVSPLHISDTRLSHPELKYKVGAKVNARVVSKKGKRLQLTMKKSLVNAEEIISDLASVSEGQQSPGTVEAFVKNGALVSFFGNVRAFLPVSEISEAFVTKAEDVLRLGQTIKVRVSQVREHDEGRLVVSMRDLTRTRNAEEQWAQVVEGKSVVSASVVAKDNNNITVEFNGLRGVLRDGHLADGTYEQCRLRFKKIKVGGQLDVVVLEKDQRGRSVIVSAKKSLLAAAKTGIPHEYSEIQMDATYTGYVRSVTNMGLFVTFAGRLTGLVLPKNAAAEDLHRAYYKDQTVVCRVVRVDDDQRRFLLAVERENVDFLATKVTAPVDTAIQKVGDYAIDSWTLARVTSVEPFTLTLAENVPTYVDPTQIGKATTKVGEEVKVKVIGYRDMKTYEFGTSVGKNSAVEVSMKEGEDNKDFDLESISVGDEVESYVRNSHNGFLYTSFSPQVSGRIAYAELGPTTADEKLVENCGDAYLLAKFPIGTKLKAVVKSVERKTINLQVGPAVASVSELEVGKAYHSRVFTIKDNLVLVEMGPGVVGCAYLADALNDYSRTLSETFSKNDYACATVLEIDHESSRVALSLRTAGATSKTIRTHEDLVRGEKITGFVKKISNIGLHVALGHTVHALVRVGDLFDTPTSEWKKMFRLSQAVEGRILECSEPHRVLMTLKPSEVQGKFALLKCFEDLNVGDVFEGSVKNVQEFGVFVKLDGTANLSGLCHRSQIADAPVADVAALFSEGDRVKVKVLEVDQEARKMSLGMKASYFGDVEEESDEEKEEEEKEEEEVVDDEMDSEENMDEADESDEEDNMDVDSDEETSSSKPLSLSAGFDWTASILDQAEDSESSDEEDFTVKKKKKKARTEDKTGDISTRAPQSTSDFERLLVGNPNSSVLWMNYMSFQLQLSEIEKAREIGERALKTIGYREETEKMNIWIAMLNLENTFGTDESLNDVFKRSCQYMDALTMHQKLVGIYQMSEKFDAAEALYQSMIKRFAKVVAVWVSYGAMLLERGKTQETHEVLAKALQALDKRDHIEVVRKFAQLEFAKGEVEQGRSLFEGLIADAPKRIDLWNVYIDQEMKVGDKAVIEGLFERVVQKKLSRKQMKFFYGKWLAFEEDKGDEVMAARVKAKAVEAAKTVQ